MLLSLSAASLTLLILWLSSCYTVLHNAKFPVCSGLSLLIAISFRIFKLYQIILCVRLNIFVILKTSRSLEVCVFFLSSFSLTLFSSIWMCVV